jgi:hypothetical protein
MANSKTVLSCVKISGETWATQIELAMAGEAMKTSLVERRRGQFSIPRTSSTGAVHISVFEVYDA